jgi:MATE family multidrug resistance protein
MTKEIAKDYYNIRIWSAPATLLLYVWMGWFVGMQDTRTPMILSITINLINIGLSIIFVKYFHLEVKGVALGSLIAEYLGLMLAYVLFLKKYKPYKQRSPLSTILNKTVLLRFFSVNSNLFIRSILLIGSLSYFTSKSASLGNETLAANSIMMQYFFVFSYFMDGFAYAAEALTGKYFGNKNHTFFKKIVSKVFSWGWGLSIVFSMLYLLFYQNLIGLLTDNPRLHEIASHYTYWMVLIPITTFAAFLWDGIFVGTLSTVAMRNAMLLAGLLVFLPAVMLLLPLYGNHGLWIAFHLFMGSRSMAMWYFSKTIAVPSQSE